MGATEYLRSRKQFGVALNTFRAPNVRAAEVFGTDNRTTRSQDDDAVPRRMRLGTRGDVVAP